MPLDMTPQSTANDPADPPDRAALAGLVYVSPDAPGIARLRAGQGFAYRDAEGHRVTDPDTLARIKVLAFLQARLGRADAGKAA